MTVKSVSRRSASLKTDRCNGQHIDFRTRMAEGVFMNFNRFLVVSATEASLGVF